MVTSRLRRGLGSRFGVAVVASLITASVFAGVAYASIPDRSGAIHGCYGKVGGVLRVVDNARQCNAHFETPISWNKSGPEGPPGPQGPPGTGTMLSFGYPQVENCGTGVSPGHPAGDPCPFRVTDAPAGVTVTPVMSPTQDIPLGYCVAGLPAVPTSVLGSVGSEARGADGSLLDLLTTAVGEPIEVQPPSNCPADSQIIVRWVREDDLGGAYCSESFSQDCASLVYRLVLG